MNEPAFVATEYAESTRTLVFGSPARVISFTVVGEEDNGVEMALIASVIGARSSSWGMEFQRVLASRLINKGWLKTKFSGLWSKGNATIVCDVKPVPSTSTSLIHFTAWWGQPPDTALQLHINKRAPALENLVSLEHDSGFTGKRKPERGLGQFSADVRVATPSQGEK